MSDVVSNFRSIMKEAEEIRLKKSLLEQNRIENQYKKLEQSKIEAERQENMTVRGLSEDQIKMYQAQALEYFSKAKTGGVFLNIEEFSDKVPMFARNLILVGAQSGSGKSTLTSNMARAAKVQKKRVLVITNEEHVVDVYNRITCLDEGWNYSTNHKEFTEDQAMCFAMKIAEHSEYITVMDDGFSGGIGLTTTIEGINSILEKLLSENDKYDLVIIDYYQNISGSLSSPEMNEYQVQEQVARSLDGFKNRYDAPIIVLAQLKPGKDEDIPFKLRVEGRKVIYNVCTTAIEVVRDRETPISDYIIRKSRFPAGLGEKVQVGFDKGRLIQCSIEFKVNAELEKQRKLTEKALKAANLRK